jgi:hypothetical protein
MLGRRNPQPTSQVPRQTRASPGADRAVSGGFERFHVGQLARQPTGLIPLNRAENRSGKPKIGRRLEGATFGGLGFQDRRIQPLCHPSGIRA